MEPSSVYVYGLMQINHEPRTNRAAIFYGLKNHMYVPVEKVSLHEKILDPRSTIPRTGGLSRKKWT